MLRPQEVALSRFTQNSQNSQNSQIVIVIIIINTGQITDQKYLFTMKKMSIGYQQFTTVLTDPSIPWQS